MGNPIFDKNTSWLSKPNPFINSLVSSLLSFFIIIAILYFVITIIQSGYKYMTSHGDKNKVQEVNERLTYAFIGLVVVFSIFALLKLIGSIFGIQGLENLQITWPTL